MCPQLNSLAVQRASIARVLAQSGQQTEIVRLLIFVMRCVPDETENKYCRIALIAINNLQERHVCGRIYYAKSSALIVVAFSPAARDGNVGISPDFLGSGRS